MATFWRYVRLQFAVLVCGIVGPIFLAVFFSVHPQQDMKWMYYMGLIITTADVLIALWLTMSAERDSRPSAEAGSRG